MQQHSLYVNCANTTKAIHAKKMRKRSLKYSPCHRVKSHIFEVKIAKNSRVDIFATGGRGIFFLSAYFFQKNNAKSYVIEC